MSAEAKNHASGAGGAPTNMMQPMFTPTRLLSKPLLAQMATVLPKILKLTSASVVFFASSGIIDLDHLTKTIAQQRNPLLVLFLGNQSERGLGALLDRARPLYSDSQNPNDEINFGTDIVFQHAPVHQVFRHYTMPHCSPVSEALVDKQINMSDHTLGSNLGFSVALNNFFDDNVTLTFFASNAPQSVFFRRPCQGSIGEKKEYVVDEWSFDAIEVVTFDRCNNF